MIAYRQRGFINAYAFAINGMAVGLLLGYSQLIKLTPAITLSPGVSLTAYCLAVFVGMAASIGHIRSRGYTLNSIGWFGGMALAIRQVVFVAACIFALMFATKDREISRLFLGTYLFLLACVLTALHAKFPRALARMLFAEKTQSPTLFVSQGEDMADLADWIVDREHLGICPVGFISEKEPSLNERAVSPYLGGIDRLEALLKQHRVRQVVLLGWMADTDKVEHIIELCEQSGCRFLINNNLASRFARPLVAVQEGGHHLLALQEEPLEDPLNRLCKRSLDLAIALPVVVLLLPPLTVCVWLVQRSQAPGPVFFVRPRGGHNLKTFKMLKFRSMYAADQNINQQATPGDRRIYPFGKFLRRTSLDEFPQFINVLNGSMSVVGPRPHLPQHDEDFSQISRAYRVRALVKPGITGLAQIHGFRGEITAPDKLHQRVSWDLNYVANWSAWLDIQIVLRTAIQVTKPPTTAY